MTDGHNRQHLDLIMRHQSTGLYPCESEEALGSSESEPAKPARRRGKRSRAAEVHNLSEKRRRSRINEKMKALQSLIPNSSKTDKASMLDDAIEYLKQLQLQVQMLSMRNGLYLPPVNLSGAPEPLPASQMCASLNQNSDKASNPPEPQFLLESSQSNLRSFQLTVSPEMIFQEDVMLKHRLSSAQDTTSVPGQQSKSFWQERPIVSADCFDRGSLRKEQSQDMKPKNTESVLFMTHLHSLQSGDTEAGLRTGTR